MLYDRDLLDKYGGSLEKALAAYNFGPKNLDYVMKAHPNDWRNFVPPETQKYLNNQVGINIPGITIQNQTGGSAVVVANALGGGT
jgi:hypothetical protein